MATSQKFARVVQVCVRGFGKVGHERANASGITPQQADAIELIDARGMVSTGVFAQLLGIDPSTASRNLAGLQRAGLISRKHHSEDGRQTGIRLTPKGKRVAEALSTETLRAFSTLLEKVPRTERQPVVDALGVLAGAVTAGEAGGQGRGPFTSSSLQRATRSSALPEPHHLTRARPAGRPFGRIRCARKSGAVRA